MDSKKGKQGAFGSDSMLHHVFVSFISSVFFSYFFFTDCPFLCFFLLNLRVVEFLFFFLFLDSSFFSFSLFFALSWALRAFGVFTPNLAFQHSFECIIMTLNRVRKCFGQWLYLWCLNKKMDIGSKGLTRDIIIRDD